jgi:hypothetical protein
VNEETVRRIVNEELGRRDQERRSADAAMLDRHRQQVLRDTAPDDSDGPLVTELKALFREGWE